MANKYRMNKEANVWLVREGATQSMEFFYVLISLRFAMLCLCLVCIPIFPIPKDWFLSLAMHPKITTCLQTLLTSSSQVSQPPTLSDLKTSQKWTPTNPPEPPPVSPPNRVPTISPSPEEEQLENPGFVMLLGSSVIWMDGQFSTSLRLRSKPTLRVGDQYTPSQTTRQSHDIISSSRTRTGSKSIINHIP